MCILVSPRNGDKGEAGMAKTSVDTIFVEVYEFDYLICGILVLVWRLTTTLFPWSAIFGPSVWLSVYKMSVGEVKISLVLGIQLQ